MVKKIITPISRLFFRWIPLVFMRVGFIVFGVIGKAFGKVLRAIGRVVLMPYNAAARAYRAFLPKALARPAAVLGHDFHAAGSEYGLAGRSIVLLERVD